MSLLTSKVKDMIGKEVIYIANEEISLASIRYFALAIDDHNQLYSSEEFASKTKWNSVKAPSTFIFETNQYMNKSIDSEGYLGHTWEIPLEDEYSIVRGGNEYKIFAPLLPSTLLEVKWKINNIIEKEGKSRSFLIVSSIVQYFDQNKKLLAENLEDMIYIPKN